eukprot:4197103-Pleurochrysis_carterae.AAC.1
MGSSRARNGVRCKSQLQYVETTSLCYQPRTAAFITYCVTSSEHANHPAHSLVLIVVHFGFALSSQSDYQFAQSDLAQAPA